METQDNATGQGGETKGISFFILLINHSTTTATIVTPQKWIVVLENGQHWICSSVKY